MPASGSTPVDVTGLIPVASTATPSNETVGGNPGSNPAKYAQEGHQHPRLTSTTYATLDGLGQAVVPFTRTFINKPGVVVTEVDANINDQPLVVRVVGWTMANGVYTGCTIKGSRAQVLPTISPVSGILTAVITGVNALVSGLTNYNVFGGMAQGATVSVVAIVRSDMA